MSIIHASPTKPHGKNTGQRKRIDKDTHQKVNDGSPVHDIDNVWARAPYNFVNLPDKIVEISESDIWNQDSYEKDAFTGFIKCNLKTLTPLYVRSMMKLSDFIEHGGKSFNDLTNEQKEERAGFFSVEEFPVIPASTLRGMIRSVVEIITFSKIQWVTNDPLVYRAVAESPDGNNATALGESYKLQMEVGGKPIMKAGYIWETDGEWYIRPAPSLNAHPFGVTKLPEFPIGATIWHDCANARQVSVDFTTSDIDKKGDRVYPPNFVKSVAPINAIMVKTGPGIGRRNEKNNYLFALPDNNSPSKDLLINEHLVNRYIEQITPKQENILKNSNGALRHGQPVFYLSKEKDGKEDLIFFGHARYFRLPYGQSPLDLIPPDLRSSTTFDLADSIFGYVERGPDNKARAGKVFFTDAHLANDELPRWLPVGNEGWLTPHILSSPKPTTFQHYLAQDPLHKHEPDCKSDLAHYDTPSSQTQIRGHKLYWRKNIGANQQAFANLQFSGDPTKSAKQLTGIKPLDSESNFSFNLRFENLSAHELGAVLWALKLPDGHCHSLGMGKPLGMGAASINVDLYLSRRCPQRVVPGKKQVTTPKTRYEKLFSSENHWFTTEENAQDQVKSLTNDFKRFMLLQLGRQPNTNLNEFENLKRILEFLIISQWPPNADAEQWKRYMALDRSQEYNGYEVNEFAKRPVLPQPQFIESTRFITHRQSAPCRNWEQPSPNTPRNLLLDKSHDNISSKEKINSEEEEIKLITLQKINPEKDKALPASNWVDLLILKTSKDRKTFECALKEGLPPIARIDITEKGCKDFKAGDWIKARKASSKKISGLDRYTTEPES